MYPCQPFESRHRARESIPRRHAEVCRAREEGEGEGGEGDDGAQDEQQGHRNLGTAFTGILF